MPREIITQVLITNLALSLGGCSLDIDDLGGGSPQPSGWSCQPKVLVIVFNPILEADGGISLIKYYGWNNPEQLARDYIADISECSWGQVNYVISEWIELDEWPLFDNGFRYTDESYKAAWEARQMQPGV